MNRPFGRGPTTPLRRLTITMVINHVSKSWDDPPSTVSLASLLIIARLRSNSFAAGGSRPPNFETENTSLDGWIGGTHRSYRNNRFLGSKHPNNNNKTHNQNELDIYLLMVKSYLVNWICLKKVAKMVS